MADELKNQQVQLMMTRSQLDAIDDWSFEVRIRSRSEAIRRLIQYGLDAQRAARKKAKEPKK